MVNELCSLHTLLYYTGNSNNHDNNDDGGLSGGQIAGIVIGSLVGTAIIIILLCIVVYHYVTKSKKSCNDELTEASKEYNKHCQRMIKESYTITLQQEMHQEMFSKN